MTTLHPFPTSRKSVLTLWSAPAQSQHSLPNARVLDLFVLHGMLFTIIQLDDFTPNPFTQSTLNPYLTILVTFLAKIYMQAGEGIEFS